MKACKQKQLRDLLSKNHACYVLITCDTPTDDGNMQVEMSYGGPVTLAGLLLQGAQSIIDEKDQDLAQLD